jgi:hypothetical protein
MAKRKWWREKWAGTQHQTPDRAHYQHGSTLSKCHYIQNQNDIRKLNIFLGDYLQFGVLLIHLEVVGLAGVDIDELLSGGIPLRLVIVVLCAFL